MQVTPLCRVKREEERIQRELAARETEEALALLDAAKKKGKGIKLKARTCAVCSKSGLSRQQKHGCLPMQQRSAVNAPRAQGSTCSTCPNFGQCASVAQAFRVWGGCRPHVPHAMHSVSDMSAQRRRSTGTGFAWPPTRCTGSSSPASGWSSTPWAATPRCAPVSKTGRTTNRLVF